MSVFTAIGASNHTAKERQEDEYYATEPRAAELLLEVEDLCGAIWEPSCGGGHLAEVFKKAGFRVTATDLIDRGYGKGGIDFLNTNVENLAADIVTNPPFKLAEQFVRKALNSVLNGHKVCMFLKIQWLEGKRRRKFFEEFPPKIVYVSSSRLNCAMNGDFDKYPSNNAICYAWFIWEKGYQGRTTLDWIN